MSLHELPFMMQDLCMEACFGGHGAVRSRLPMAFEKLLQAVL